MKSKPLGIPAGAVGGPAQRSPAAAALKLAGLVEPLDIHLDFEAEAVDEILQRLTEPRAQMLPPAGSSVMLASSAQSNLAVIAVAPTILASDYPNSSQHSLKRGLSLLPRLPSVLAGLM